MIYFLLLLIFIIIFFIIYVILVTINKDKIQIENRILQIKNLNPAEEESIKNINFSDRTIRPIYQCIYRCALKITPRNKMMLLSKKLDKAGLLKNSTVESWIYIKNVGIIILSLVFGILAYIANSNISIAIFVTLFAVLAVNIIFNFYIACRITNRKKQILKDLPFTLDLITVSVEAGLSFDGAMIKVINNIEGDICDEFAKSIKEIKMGIQRKVALKNMSERCEVKELSSFITSIIQADEMGISLGKVLRIEAANLRERRKQAAREQAMKAPVKMLFPLIFFIFPSIFIIILGPAIIKIINIF